MDSGQVSKPARGLHREGLGYPCPLAAHAQRLEENLSRVLPYTLRRKGAPVESLSGHVHRGSRPTDWVRLFWNDGRRNGDSHAGASGRSYVRAGAHSGSHAAPHSHGGSHGHACADRDSEPGDAHPCGGPADRDATAEYTGPTRYADTNRDADRGAHYTAHTDAHAGADRDADAHTGADRDADADAHSDTHAEPYGRVDNVRLRQPKRLVAVNPARSLRDRSRGGATLA